MKIRLIYIIYSLMFFSFFFLSTPNNVLATVGSSCEVDLDCSPDETCHCTDGQACTTGVCVGPDYSSTCSADGRQYCVNSGGSGRHTCCEAGYKCGPGGDGCVPAGGGGGSCGNSSYGINCPSGTVKGTTLVSRVCARPTYCPGPGSAQNDSGVCCNTLTEPAVCGDWYYCPTPNNPSKMCRDCTDEVVSCLYNYIDTYNCVPVKTPVPVITPSPLPSASPTSIPTPVPTGQCSMTKIYTNGWVELTPQAFSGLTQGIQVYFCVNGVTNTSVFDSGRFTINGVVRPQTTVKKPGTNDFCDLYTIPANTYSFKVQGELHHTLLGWL